MGNNISSLCHKSYVPPLSETTATAVADVMVAEVIHDGLLAKIFEYVHCSESLDYETIMLGTTQDDVIDLMLVSKRFHKIISTYEENGRKFWNIITVLEIKPPSQSRFFGLERRGSERRLFNNLRYHSTNNSFQHCHHMVVKDRNKINSDMKFMAAFRLVRSFQLDEIISLKISSSFVDDVHESGRFMTFLFQMLPKTNLREMDLSNINVKNMGFAPRKFVLLERIRWNNIQLNANFMLSGFQMSRCNLQHIIMEDSIFICHAPFRTYRGEQRPRFADFEDPNNNNNGNDNNDDDNDNGNEYEDRNEVLYEDSDEDEDNFEDGRGLRYHHYEHNFFIFHECCEKLVRLSIRNAKYVELDIEGKESATQPITQKALIKFVMNAPPSLNWFRSDLTPENIQFLQTERPDIEFLN